MKQWSQWGQGKKREDAEAQRKGMAERLERAFLRCPGQHVELNQDLMHIAWAGFRTGPVNYDHPPLPEFPRATKQQAVTLLTASPVNPGGVSFCSRLLSPAGLQFLLQIFPLARTPCPPGHALGRWTVPCRVHAAQTAASILGALTESLLDGYRAHLVVLHSPVGLSEGKGTGSQLGQMRAEGTIHSSQWQPRSEKAPSPWDVLQQPVLSCLEGFGSLWGAWLLGIHVPLSQEQTACVFASKWRPRNLMTKSVQRSWLSLTAIISTPLVPDVATCSSPVLLELSSPLTPSRHCTLSFYLPRLCHTSGSALLFGEGWGEGCHHWSLSKHCWQFWGWEEPAGGKSQVRWVS